MSVSKKLHLEALALFCIALILLIFSLIAPFFSIQFHPEIPPSIEKAKDMIYASSGVSLPFLSLSLKDFAELFFGAELFSTECQPKWNDCFREWLAQKAGFSTGNQYLIQLILASLKEGSVFLGCLVLLFSVLFPLVKIGTGVLISINKFSKETQQRYYRFLIGVGKWSMTDVFVIALLILFFKAEHIHLSFQAEVGVFCFAISALFSSLASMRLGKSLGAKISFQD